MELCMQMYGEYHILTSRLYINIGIVYEDTNNYKKAYEFFKKWARVSEEILGPEHPKTLRAKGVLRETRYRSIARDLGEWNDEEDDNNDEESEEEEETENRDLEHYYDDQIGQSNNEQLLQMDNSLIGENSNNNIGNVIEIAPDVDDSNGEVLMNGYHEQEEQEAESDREHSDNENFYDDHFEDYDEQYMLYADNGPVIEEFNANLNYDDDDDDDDIIQMASSELNDLMINVVQRDNRYASDSHESSDSDEETSQRRVRHSQLRD